MKKWIVFLWIIGMTFQASAQQNCSLQRNSNYQKTSGRNFWLHNLKKTNPSHFGDIGLHLVGNIHNSEGDKICSALLRGSYALTHSDCIKKMKSNRVRYYFSITYNGYIYTSHINKLANNGNLGGITLTSDLPWTHSNISFEYPFASMREQHGWVMLGGDDGHLDRSTLSSLDDCKYVGMESGRHRFSCRHYMDYFVTGTLIMGKFCGQWYVTGFQSNEPNRFNSISRYSYNQILKQLKVTGTSHNHQNNDDYEIFDFFD